MFESAPDSVAPLLVRPNLTFWLFRLFGFLIGVALIWQSFRSLGPDWPVSDPTILDRSPILRFAFGFAVGLICAREGLFALQVAKAGRYLAVLSEFGVGVVTLYGWRIARWSEIEKVGIWSVRSTEGLSLFAAKPHEARRYPRIGTIWTGPLASRTDSQDVMEFIARFRPDLAPGAPGKEL